jgi:transcriptional regulator with XRE-family HTH domain
MSTTSRPATNQASTTDNHPPGEPSRATGPALRVRARCAPASVATGRTGRDALAALLRQLRTDHGLSTRRLADRAGIARSTLQRLEHGKIRPRPSTLGWIAGAIDPDRRAEIRDRLIAAAAGDLAPHSEVWSWSQIRRMNNAVEAGRAPLPVAMARQVRLTAASEAMGHAAMVLTDRAADLLDQPETGRLVDEMIDVSGLLRDESARLAADVGDLVFATPPRRWRGDPPDVSPFAPPLSDLTAVRQWVREWQVRERRLNSQSARERAIAATGERERQAIRDAPEPPPARPRSIAEGTRSR